MNCHIGKGVVGWTTWTVFFLFPYLGCCGLYIFLEIYRNQLKEINRTKFCVVIKKWSAGEVESNFDTEKSFHDLDNC